MRSLFNIVLTAICMLCLWSCTEEIKPTLFSLKKDTSLAFLNQLDYTEEFNPYTYRNFYNGAGVALGDINNDGLIDVYFTGNIVDNKLFLNKGNWEFEDITHSSGTACTNVWSSGANFVDINADGLLDLYVCKAGKPEGANRHNELFINNGDLTFTERSKEYNLDIIGLSIQSAFFDYDRDGDLDCYILNNSIRSVGGLDLIDGKREVPSSNGNKFLENRDNKFYDVSEKAGIYSSDIGYGLGITLSDFNQDGWTDIYISNDFFEKDYLYINNQDATFSEKGEDYFECYPAGAMGADAADLDNDLMPDLFITEMLPSTLERKKTKAVYESWKKASLAYSKGYYHQMPRNVLQRNMGNSGFLELGRMSHVDATDWSWSSLLQDYDNDGLKDIIITNGIYKDLLDRDYLAFIANDANVKNLVDRQSNAITKLIDSMPTKAVSNHAYQNMGEFLFLEKTKDWGLDQASFSNGIVYGDLDNDGDLDLIVNNVNMPSFIYENQTNSKNHYIQFSLIGKTKNTKAIGTTVIVYACGETRMLEHFPSRGFHSSMSNILSMGLGDCMDIDSISIEWYNGEKTQLKDIQVDQRLEIDISKSQKIEPKQSYADVRLNIDTLSFQHKEIKYNQFDRERLMYKMNTAEGPSISVADCNGDGFNDVFYGGAKNQASEIWLSTNGQNQLDKVMLEYSIRSEVTESAFFDSDNDGDQDLYIAHGGTAFSPFAEELHDMHYINDGNGNFELNNEGIKYSNPIATGALAIADYNLDGLQDILIGDRNSNKLYGEAGSLYLQKNKGNNQFELLDIPAFKDLGIITDAQWIHLNDDRRPDLVVVGEWMNIHVFVNADEGFVDKTSDYGLSNTAGLWNTVLVSDFNKDGLDDILVGNAGTNQAITINHKLVIEDFDQNGSKEQILCELIDGTLYPALDMDELMSQLPSTKKKFIYYKDYAKANMESLFSKSSLENAKILNLQCLESQLYYQSNGSFVKQKLPQEIQYSSIHKAISHDFDGDGTIDVLLGGNHYLIKPQYGREDASRVWIVGGINTGTDVEYAKAKSLDIRGELRDLELLNEQQLLIGLNNKAVLSYKFK